MGYNAFDMMTSYEKKENGETVFLQKNIFDGNGRRVEKQEIREKQDQTINLDDSAESDVQLEKVTKKYIYQGDTVLGTDTASIDVTGFDGSAEGGLEEMSSFNVLTPGGNVIAASRKNESDADASENWYTYNADYQGSTTSIVGSSGDAVSTYEYDDYGSITEETDAIDNEICYTGQYYDEGTGLYYYNARYYDSQNACFTSMDTYRGDNTLPLTLNLYMYCGGNPINFTDPTGHRFWKNFKKYVKNTYKKYVPKKVKRKISKAVSNVKRSNTGKKLYSLKIKATKKCKAVKKCIKKNRALISGNILAVSEIVYLTNDNIILKNVAGHIAKKMHYSRNNYSVKLPESKEVMDKSLWHDGVPANAHQFSAKNDKSNEKFVFEDGKSEVIFDKYGEIVTDPRDAGTYNYGPSDQGNKVYAVVNHAIKDVVPYLIWGNTKEESRMTNPIQRTLALGGIYF